MKAKSPTHERKWQRGSRHIPHVAGNGQAVSPENKGGCQTPLRRETEERKGFRAHIAVVGSLKGVSGRDAACGWALVQRDYDQKEEPWYATYGSMLAEFGSAENDQKSRVVGLHHGACKLDGFPPPSTPTMWALLMGCGGEKKDAFGWNHLALLTACAEKNWDLDVHHGEGTPNREGEERYDQNAGICDARK